MRELEKILADLLSRKKSWPLKRAFDLAQEERSADGS